LVLCMVKECGASVNQAGHDGGTPLYIAAQLGYEALVRGLVKECGADVDQTEHRACSPLFVAAGQGQEAVVLCLAKELGADVNLAANDGSTPLMTAARHKHKRVVRILLKLGANLQAMHHEQLSTAADFSKAYGASAEQTAYLEARTHCSNPGCEGTGRKCCAECKHARYCCLVCQHAHWPAHKAECKEAAKARAKGGEALNARRSRVCKVFVLAVLVTCSDC
jgi:hypothetical protein